MFGISGAELMVILLVALVVLGPDRLPVVARKAGQILGELRKVSAGFEAEMRTAMYDTPTSSSSTPPNGTSTTTPTLPTTTSTPGPDTSDDVREGDDTP